MDGKSIEKRLTQRQLAVKSYHTDSWLILVKDVLIKYSLSTHTDLLKSQISKMDGKKKHFTGSVDSYGIERFIHVFEATLYPSQKFLNVKKFLPGKCNQLFNVTSGSDRKARRNLR